jgi:hypothetical protein
MRADKSGPSDGRILLLQVSRINSQSLLEVLIGRQHLCSNEVHHRTACLLSKLLQGKKLTENVSVSFVINILTRSFPQSRVYPSL